jgi:hypothetical protein
MYNMNYITQCSKFDCTVAGYLPSPYFMEPPQHLGPKAGDDRNTSDSMKDVEISKEQKS